MESFTDSREDRVAHAVLQAEWASGPTVEEYRAKYGDMEADNLIVHYRRKAREFLAMYDAAAQAVDPDFQEVGP
jgi:hypothetical protein